MNPIQKLVEWRLNNLISEFNITLNDFVNRGWNDEIWINIRKKLIYHDDITDSYNYRFRYCAIKNIIWKNIIIYEFVPHDSININMLYNNYKNRFKLEPYFGSLRCLILNENGDQSLDNINKMLNMIINYLLFIDQCIMKYMIFDLSSILKLYFFDVMFFCD